jgi:hypothetical protein
MSQSDSDWLSVPDGRGSPRAEASLLDLPVIAFDLVFSLGVNLGLAWRLVRNRAPVS